MSRWTRCARLSLLLLPVASPARAQTLFSGIVTYRMSMGGMDASAKMFSQEGRLRMEMAVPGMPAPVVMLMDPKAQVAQTIMESMGIYMEMDLAKAAEQAMAMMTPEQRALAQSAGPIEPLGTTETIAGTRCQNYRMTAANESSEACIATGMGWMVAPQGDAGKFLGTDLSKYADQFKTGAIMLRVVRTTGGQRQVMMEATSVERKALEPSLFQVPPGLRRQAMPGIGG